MKKPYFVLLASALSLTLCSGAFAKDAPKDKKAKDSASVSSTSSESSTPKRMAVGLTTAALVPPSSSSDAFSGAIELDSKNIIQGFFNLPSTSPFTFALGGIYKHTLVSKQNAGVHVGGGLGIGTTAGATTVNLTTGTVESGTKFFANFGGIGGLHFSIPGLNDVQFHCDGGAVLSVGPSTTFGIGSLSGVAGISVLFWL